MQKTNESNLHPQSSNIFEPKNDGKDHVNIYSRGKTNLGKALSNFAHYVFSFEGITYQSIEGALYYYRTGNTKLIKLYGSEAKKIGSKSNEKRIESPELLKAWLYAKIFSNPELIALLLNNRLPFSHYYIMFGRKIDAGIELPDLWREITDDLRYIYKQVNI